MLQRDPTGLVIIYSGRAKGANVLISIIVNVSIAKITYNSPFAYFIAILFNF